MENDHVDLAHLIRSIQRAEGKTDCFDRAAGYCDHMDCAWRELCLGKSQDGSVKDGKLR